MAIVTNPNGATLYPGQTQVIKLATQGTALPSWQDFTQGTQNASRQLVYSGSGGYVQASGLNYCFAGGGRFSITIGAANFPASGGSWRLQFTSATTINQWMRMEFTHTGAITMTTKAPNTFTWIQSDGTIGTSASVPSDGTEYGQTRPSGLTGLTAAIGQTINFEISLTGIVITGIDGTIEWTTSGAVALGGAWLPPFFYLSKVTTPVSSGTATVDAPVLVGDWRPGTSGAWSVSPDTSYVTLDTASAVRENTINVSSTAQPGQYAITVAQAAVGGSQLDDVTSYVQVPYFLVNSASEITVTPSQRLRITTTYDGQTGVTVTRSASSGTFQGLDYIAPSSAGSDTLTFTSGTQTRTVTATVRSTLTMTPATTGAAISVDPDVTMGLEPGEVISFTTTMGGTLTWTISSGSLGSGTTTRSYTVPNVYGAMITLLIESNSGDEATYTFKTMKKFPYSPSVDTDYRRSKPSTTSKTIGGKMFGRVKSVNGQTLNVIGLAFLNRELDELQGAQTFFDDHDPDGIFIYENIDRGERYNVQFVPESWNDRDLASGAKQYGFTLQEVNVD